MEFEPVTQNGIDVPTEYFILPSRFALAVSTTTCSVIQPITFKAYSDAQIYKRKPVTFYKTTGTSTTVIGVGTWVSTTTCQLQYSTITNTGTYQIHASWPGELKYAPKSTELNPITLTVRPADPYPGTFTLTTLRNPINVFSTGTMRLVSSFGTTISGQVNVIATATVFVGQNSQKVQTQIETVNFANSSSVNFSINGDSLYSSSTWYIRAEWQGGNIDGSPYYGASSNKVTENVTTGTVTLTSSDSPAIYNSPYTLTASISTTSNNSAYVQFFDGATLIGTQASNGNLANFVTTSTTGTHSISAVWSHQTSNPISQQVIFATPATLTLSVPNPYNTYDIFGNRLSNPNATMTIRGQVANHQPIGVITLTDSEAILGTTSVNGSGTYTISWNPLAFNQFRAGARTLQAAFVSTNNYNLNVSTTATFSAVGATFGLALTSNKDYVYTGESLTLTATKNTTATIATPVVFFDNTSNASIGSANFIGNTATVTISNLTGGTYYDISASVLGNTTREIVTSNRKQISVYRIWAYWARFSTPAYSSNLGGYPGYPYNPAPGVNISSAGNITIGLNMDHYFNPPGAGLPYTYNGTLPAITGQCEIWLRPTYINDLQSSQIESGNRNQGLGGRWNCPYIKIATFTLSSNSGSSTMTGQSILNLIQSTTVAYVDHNSNTVVTTPTVSRVQADVRFKYLGDGNYTSDTQFGLLGYNDWTAVTAAASLDELYINYPRTS